MVWESAAVPPAAARWIKAGLWAGAGVFVALSLSHRGDIATLVQ